jgi:predicted  nucleic acid-binding Zn-ribbon protein
VDLIVDDGLNVAEAMRQINSEGYRKRNGEEWDYFNFYRMLRDDAMRGVSVFRKVRATGKGSTRLAADGSPLLGATVTRQLPEIVPAARVALLDVALKRNGTGPRDSDAYLLSGHIIGECGAHYIGQFRDGVRKYMCTGHATPVDPNCNDPWLREDVTDEKVWEVLRPALEDEKQLQRWAAEWIAQLPKDRERHSTNVTALTAEVKKLRTQLEGLVIRIEDPEIDADERELLQASKTTLMSTWKLKKAELEQATELLTDYDAMKADIEMMAEAVQNARLRISEMTLQEKALLLDLCKVEVRIVEGGEIRAKTGLPSPAELWHIEQNVLVPDEPSDEAWQAAYDAIYPAGSKRRARANPETTKAYALAMLHRFRTGVTWSEAQPLYLPGVHWHTLASRQRKWWNDGTWKTLVTTLLEHGTGSPLGTPGRQKIVLEVTGLTLGVLVSDGFLTCLDSTVSPRVAELMRMCSFTLRTT